MRDSRIVQVLSLMAAVAGSSCQAPITDTVSEASVSRPNIILINVDDLGYGDLSSYGSTLVQTPNIDRLASEGVRFTDAHSASAVCSPSRYGLLTGRYPLRRNFWGPVSHTTPLTIDTNTETLASLLKRAGYRTAIIGKWHLGFGLGETDWNRPLKPGPLELGFDYYFGIPKVNSGPPFVYIENHEVVGFDPDDPFVFGQRSATEEWPAKRGYDIMGGATAAHLLYKDREIGATLTSSAVEWIRKSKQDSGDAPLFLYFATTHIHHPFTPAVEFEQTSGCGRYCDFIHELDWMVGELLDTLDELDIVDNTLVIFTSDNGGMLNVAGQEAWDTGHRMNGDLLGFKFGAWEGGHRVPLIIRWPAEAPPNRVSNQLISHIDLLATFSAIVDVPLRQDAVHDGVNQLPAFLGESSEPQREYLVLSPNRPSHLSIRKGKWMFIPSQNEGGFGGTEIGDHSLGGAAALAFTRQINSDIRDGKVLPGAPPAQLYDLEADLSQSANVYDKHPDVVRELEALLDAYRNEVGEYPELGWIVQ